MADYGLIIFPQIAIAIGVLTSNGGEGDKPLWPIGRGTRVPLQGAMDVVPLLGAIIGCHYSVLWLRGRVITKFGGVNEVLLLGDIAGCHCSVLWSGEGRVMTNFGGVDVVPLLGAIAGCHCSVLWLKARVMTNFGKVDVVPLLGAIVGCHCGVLWGSGRSARPILGEWTWCHCWVPLLGAILVRYGWGKGVVPLQGAIVVCHLSVLWLGGRLITNVHFLELTWCYCWVPLQGAIVVCYDWGKVTANFGGVNGAIAGCHCSVLWWEGRALGGVDVVPLLGALAGCQFLVYIFVLYSGPPISRTRPRKQQ